MYPLGIREVGGAKRVMYLKSRSAARFFGRTRALQQLVIDDREMCVMHLVEASPQEYQVTGALGVQ